jgi:hypothetical protein
MDQTITFTVRDVREARRGVTDGREWTKYVITTETGAQLGTFDASWLLVIGDTVSTQVREREFNGRAYLDVIGKPPGSPPKPTSSKAGPGHHALASNAAGVQTVLAQGPGVDAQALVRLEAALEQLTRRVDSMGAVLGDVAEETRTITTLLQRRLPILPEDDVDEPADAPAPEDPGPPEPPEPDDESEEDPYDV